MNTHLKAMLDIIPWVVGYLNADLELLQFSKALAEWVGVPSDQCIGRKFRDLAFHLLGDEIQEPLNQALKGIRSTVEIQLIGNGSGVRIIQFSVVPDFDILQKVKGMTFYIQDLSKLKFSQIENETIFNTISEALVVQNNEGQIERFNQSAIAFLGLKAEEIKNKKSTELGLTLLSEDEDEAEVPPGSRPSELALKSGKPLRNQIVKVKLRSGDIRWVKINITPFLSQEGEKLISSFVDMSDEINQKNEMQKIIHDLKVAQSTAKIGSWQYDLRNGKQSWSSEHYRIFEIEEPQTQEQLHQLYRERIHPDDLSMLDKVINRALKKGEDFVYDHRVCLDGGTRIKYVRGIGKVARDSGGHPIYVSGTCQDLTEVVAIQKQNRLILDSMQIGVWQYNPVTQSLLWDDSMYKLFEIVPTNFSGHYEAWEKSLSDDAKEQALFELGQALRGEKEFNTTFEIVTKSGGRKYLGGRGVVVRNERNEPIMMYGINWDRTLEYLKERELIKSKQLLQDIIDSSNSTIFIKDLRGRYLAVNQFYSRILGKASDEIIGKTVFDLFPQALAQKMWERDQTVIQVKQNLVIEEQLPVDNKLRWHLISLFPIGDGSGEPFGIGGIITDIQESRDIRDQYEREIEIERSKAVLNSKLASLGEMAAGIAHEINNPLAVVMGTLSLLESFRSDPEKHKNKIDSMQRAVQRIEKIVRGLKKFSRSSTGVEHKIESMENLVNESLIITESKLKKFMVSLEVDIEEELQIFCDGVEIEQVLINLINNAIDAIKDQGKPWIKIRGFKRNGSAHLQIIDSGTGIDASVEQKLFQPFFTTKKVGEGTGLGLSISKGILENHNAKLLLNKEIKNTCFEIQFSDSHNPQVSKSQFKKSA